MTFCIPEVIVYLFSQALVTPSADRCLETNSAVVSALLSLHSGANCTTLQLSAIQQMAALQATIDLINNEMKAQDGLTIGNLTSYTK